MRISFYVVLLLMLLTVACTPQATIPLEPTPSITREPEDAPTDTLLTPTHTAVPSQTADPTLTVTATLSPTLPSPSPASEVVNTALVIDHNSIVLFESIPEEYIQAASQMHLLFRHASVGKNITDGLDCLMNNFPKRPYYCDKGIPPDQVIYDQKYDRINWVFELHRPPPNINPPWWDKLGFFLERVNNLGPEEDYQVVGYTHGYVEATPGSKIDDLFFENPPGDSFPGIEDMEALELSHPGLTVMYWTMGLARVGLPDSQSFNQQMRQYVQENGKVFMDLADIESHAPDGSPCFDNEGKNIEAICDEYTDEDVNGHLNALGSLRMAKAMWILMAQLAGWKP